MDNVRLGIIGAGGAMAGNHLHNLPSLDGVELAGLSDSSEEKLKEVSKRFPKAKTYVEAEAMIDSGQVDAILIVTPHFTHPVYAQHAFAAGVHVLTEKPVAVTAKTAEQTNQAYEDAKKHYPDLVYAGMFQLRALPLWRQVHRMCHDGTLGDLMRVSWTITTWFRTQTYYDSGGWRATWEGEGGGVLLNQCPHNLDLFQWLVGLPDQVIAQVGLGKYHKIEVEDEVNAIMHFANGAVGTFMTSSGEAPGVNRLEIVGDRGTLIVEDNSIRFREVQTPVRELTRTSPARFAKPPITEHHITPGGEPPGHRGILENFIQAIGENRPLIAPGIEGIRGLELGNAMLLSGLNAAQPTALPIDREAYDRTLQNLIQQSNQR